MKYSSAPFGVVREREQKKKKKEERNANRVIAFLIFLFRDLFTAKIRKGKVSLKTNLIHRCVSSFARMKKINFKFRFLLSGHMSNVLKLQLVS